MKRNILFILLAVVSMQVFAEEGEQGFGLHLGFSQPNYRLNQPAEEVSDKNKLSDLALNGFKVGLFYEASYIKGFGSMMGLNYTYAGNSTAWTSIQAFSTWPQKRENESLHALEIFVDWQYKFQIAKDTYIILYSGPTIQCNVSFNKTVLEKNSVDAEPTKTKYSHFNYDDNEKVEDYKHLNVTWGVGAGFQYDRYFVRGGYDFGLMNPYNYDNFAKVGYTDRNTRGRLDQWQVKLGVFLWRK